MLSKLRRLIKKIGIKRAAYNMGYKSETTIRKWFLNDSIPDVAVPKVKLLLGEYNVKHQ